MKHASLWLCKKMINLSRIQNLKTSYEMMFLDEEMCDRDDIIDEGARDSHRTTQPILIPF